MKNYQLIKTSWQENREALSLIRRKVFIEEQKVPEKLEWDEYDKTSLHILVLNHHQQPVATGRIKPDGQIGRMAVLKEYRHQGIGTEIIKALIEYARQQGYPNIYLHAQTSAIPFYKHFGFTEYGNEFLDANIPHKSMRLAK